MGQLLARLNLAGDYHTWTAMTEKMTDKLGVEARLAIWGGTAARIYGIGGDKP